MSEVDSFILYRKGKKRTRENLDSHDVLGLQTLEVLDINDSHDGVELEKQISYER